MAGFDWNKSASPRSAVKSRAPAFGFARVRAPAASSGTSSWREAADRPGPVTPSRDRIHRRWRAGVLASPLIKLGRVDQTRAPPPASSNLASASRPSDSMVAVAGSGHARRHDTTARYCVMNSISILSSGDLFDMQRFLEPLLLFQQPAHLEIRPRARAFSGMEGSKAPPIAAFDARWRSWRGPPPPGRGSAPYAPMSRPRWPDNRQRPRAAPRSAPCCRTGAAGNRRRRAAPPRSAPTAPLSSRCVSRA